MRKLRKLQFIYPKFRRFYQVLADWSPLFRTTDYEADARTRTPPCLGFPLLAALTPSDVEIGFLDDRIDQLDMSRLDADLYCLHVNTEPGIPARRRAARCQPDRGARRFPHHLPVRRGEAAR